MAVWSGTFAVRRPEFERVVLTCGPEGAGALVTGQAGVGKTTLVREAADHWTEGGGHVLWIAATESARLFTFGALAGFSADLDPSDFVRSATSFLEVVGEPDRALVVVDDAHLLDPASAALVHRLALLPDRFNLVVTMDDAQSAPDAVRRLAKDRLLEVITLGPFDRGTTAAILTGSLGGHVERPTCDRLFELSGGNPFALHELVEAGVASGVLRQSNGAWSWRGTVPNHSPLKDLVALRLERAEPEVRAMLEILCLAEPLTLEQLGDLVGSEAVAAGEATGLITVETRMHLTEVRFTHVLYAQVVRASLGEVRTLRALRLLDKVLEKSPERSLADRLKRAKIRLDAADQRPDDAEVFTEASRLSRPDYELAERFARAGLGAGGGFTALDYLVDALLWQGKIEDAKEVAEAVTADLSAEEQEYFSLRWSRMLWWMAGERPEWLAEPDENSAELSPSARLGSIARQAAMAATAGRGPSVTPTALGVLADADADDEARCWAAGAAMIGLGGQGRLGDAFQLAEDAVACARRIADFNYRLLLSVVMIWLSRLSGDLTQAQTIVDDLRKELEFGPDPNAGLVALVEAETMAASGRIRAAVPLFQDAALRLDEIDFGGLSATAHLRLAESRVLTGDPLGAKVELAKGMELELRTLEIFRPEQHLMKAWTRAGIGDLKVARALAGEAASLAAAQGEQLVEVHAHHAGVRWGDRDAARRLLGMAPFVEGPFSLLAADHARAFLGRDVDGLAEVGDRFAEQGLRAEASDALAQAAKVASRADPPSAQGLANRAASMAAGVGGLDSPALRAVAVDVPLTRRQREIATLATSGMSNRAIADHMGIGVRTVESHLAAAYRRLGATGRGDLSALLPSLTPAAD
jgi:DNA-binding CsgD family transcriptional regulator